MGLSWSLALFFIVLCLFFLIFTFVIQFFVAFIITICSRLSKKDSIISIFSFFLRFFQLLEILTFIHTFNRSNMTIILEMRFQTSTAFMYSIIFINFPLTLISILSLTLTSNLIHIIELLLRKCTWKHMKLIVFLWVRFVIF